MKKMRKVKLNKMKTMKKCCCVVVLVVTFVVVVHVVVLVVILVFGCCCGCFVVVLCAITHKENLNMFSRVVFLSLSSSDFPLFLSFLPSFLSLPSFLLPLFFFISWLVCWCCVVVVLLVV